MTKIKKTIKNILEAVRAFIIELKFTPIHIETGKGRKAIELLSLARVGSNHGFDRAGFLIRVDRVWYMATGELGKVYVLSLFWLPPLQYRGKAKKIELVPGRSMGTVIRSWHGADDNPKQVFNPPKPRNKKTRVKR